MAQSREFKNDFKDFTDEIYFCNGKLVESFAQSLRHSVDKLMQRMNTEYTSSAVDWKNYTLYTGTTGIALMHLHLYRCLDNQKDAKHLQLALSYLERTLKGLRDKGVSMMCGDAGPLAVAAVVYHLLHQEKQSKQCIDGLVALQDQAMHDPSVPNEFLFGRVGYIFALLYVQHNIGEDVIDNELVLKMCDTVIRSGRKYASETNAPCPLMYEWHDKRYLGAAHGVSGILYVLMQIKHPSFRQSLEKYVKPTVDYLMTLRFPSGNYPSSIGSSSGDLLIHWCHGAPGFIHMLIQAYQVFNDRKYLDAAEGCAEVIWQRGLLRKGYGLCHGVSGNGYAFLRLYQLLNKDRYFHRAAKFAEWCFDYGKHGCRIADRPYSLFEGMAGTICFLADLLAPRHAMFPAFQLGAIN